jgi:hypothetical protein
MEQSLKDDGLDVVRPIRFELMAYGLEIRCSIRLSYGRARGGFIVGPDILKSHLDLCFR